MSLKKYKRWLQVYLHEINPSRPDEGRVKSVHVVGGHKDYAAFCWGHTVYGVEQPAEGQPIQTLESSLVGSLFLRIRVAIRLHLFPKWKSQVLFFAYNYSSENFFIFGQKIHKSLNLEGKQEGEQQDWALIGLPAKGK